MAINHDHEGGDEGDARNDESRDLRPRILGRVARRNIGWLKREINIVDDESSPSTNHSFCKNLFLFYFIIRYIWTLYNWIEDPMWM